MAVYHVGPDTIFYEEEKNLSKYYPGMERDDGWTQRLEQSRRRYEVQVDDLRRKAGLPPLSQTVVPPSHPLLTAKLQRAIMEVERVLQAGEVKYPNERWRTQGAYEHIAHALTHLHMMSSASYNVEDHLAHAACRLLMALEKRYAA